MTARPYPKDKQLARGEKRYRRRVASPSAESPCSTRLSPISKGERKMERSSRPYERDLDGNRIDPAYRDVPDTDERDDGDRYDDGWRPSESAER